MIAAIRWCLRRKANNKMTLIRLNGSSFVALIPRVSKLGTIQKTDRAKRVTSSTERKPVIREGDSIRGGRRTLIRRSLIQRSLVTRDRTTEGSSRWVDEKVAAWWPTPRQTLWFPFIRQDKSQTPTFTRRCRGVNLPRARATWTATVAECANLTVSLVPKTSCFSASTKSGKISNKDKS